jgi:hypothetical protein
MAPTATQSQQFETLRDQIAGYMHDLIEQEYQRLPQEKKERGDQFWREGTTHGQVWDELMVQWDDQKTPQ